MKKKVYISRTPAQVENLALQLEKLNVEIEAISLIETTEVKYEMPSSSFDWIFFFSSKAVEYFFAQHPSIPENVSFGAVGSITAASLNKFKTVSYTGRTNNTAQVSEDFDKVACPKIVLVPQSDISLNPLAVQLGNARCLNLVCYKTTQTPKVIVPADVLVFSSPSNVQSFFRMNALPEKARFISYGPATSRTLRDFGVEPIEELEKMDSEEIVRAIMAVLCSSEED
jgi:hydroxymethylbilane synthase